MVPLTYFDDIPKWKHVVNEDCFLKLFPSCNKVCSNLCIQDKKINCFRELICIWYINQHFVFWKIFNWDHLFFDDASVSYMKTDIKRLNTGIQVIYKVLAYNHRFSSCMQTEEHLTAKVLKFCLQLYLWCLLQHPHISLNKKIQDIISFITILCKTHILQFNWNIKQFNPLVRSCKKLST